MHTNRFLVILILITTISIVIFAFLNYIQDMKKKSHSSVSQLVPTKPLPSTIRAISEEEKQQIEDWIKKNNLNEFGDPQDTVYTGGTPLFNESTGKTIDKYEYILKQHPDRPWEKQT